jgi:hypothetical protein
MGNSCAAYRLGRTVGVCLIPKDFRNVFCFTASHERISISSPLNFGFCAMPNFSRSPSKFSVLRPNPRNPKLVESYCPGCGLLIAASPRPEVLRILERIHSCPVYFQYPKRA